jgi:FG-GAP repeat
MSSGILVYTVIMRLIMAILAVKSTSVSKNFSLAHFLKKLGTATATGATLWMLQAGIASAFTPLTRTQTFLNPTPANDDQFGWSVSISGNNVLIGAYRDDTGNTNSGAAYLFDGVTGNLRQTLLNPTPGFFDEFGRSVSISGDNVLIGARGDSSGGAAYLFNGVTGNLQQTFLNPNPARGGFGYSVAVSGNNLLIGKPYDDRGGLYSGAAYLYDAVTGNLLQTFRKPTPTRDDSFGESVAISGNKVLISVPHDDTAGTGSGAAYLFDGVTGNLLQTFLNPNPANSTFFSRDAVAISGNNVLIGSSLDNTGANASGVAYLFDGATGNLLHTFLNPTPGLGAKFGSSVSISGNNVLIGAPDATTTAGTQSGAAYLYDGVTGNLLQTLLNPAPTGVFDQFGSSVSISGNNVLIGAYGNNTGATISGAAYLFQPTQEPPSSVPEGDNVVGLLLIALIGVKLGAQ